MLINTPDTEKAVIQYITSMSHCSLCNTSFILSLIINSTHIFIWSKHLYSQLPTSISKIVENCRIWGVFCNLLTYVTRDENEVSKSEKCRNEDNSCTTTPEIKGKFLYRTELSHRTDFYYEIAWDKASYGIYSQKDKG